MKKLTYDNFGKFRHTWIHEADRICEDCRELTSQPPLLNSQSTRYWQRAAKLYHRAAEFYRKAGLGRLAYISYMASHNCYLSLGLRDDAERLLRLAESVPVHYLFEEDL